MGTESRLPKHPRLLGLTTSAFDPASRFRFIQFIPHLRKAGWEVVHRPNRPDRQWHSPLRFRLSRAVHYRAGRALMKINRLRDLRDAARFDVVFVNRDLAGTGVFFESLLHKRNPRVVFDFDDAIFIGRREAAVRWMCANAARVTPGNDYLSDYAHQWTDRVTVLPTVVDTDSYLPKRAMSPAKSGGMVKVGWSGSDQSIGSTLRPYLPMLRDLQATVPFELVIVTNTRPKLELPTLRWTFCRWQEDGESHLGSLFDIGIMPLVDGEFQKGKCGLKLLQYMAAALPTVASPVGVNRQIVLPGVTGFLATSQDDWCQALGALVRDAGMCARMGDAGRQRCVSEYSIQRHLPTLLEVLNRAAQSVA